MFQRVQIKLSLVCCAITALLALAIVLCCLGISEKNMYGQEEALFCLNANTVSYELHTKNPVSIQWYMRNVDAGEDLLYLKVDGVPSTLSEVALTEPERRLAEEVGEYIIKQGIAPITGNFTAEKEYFESGGEGSKFLVLYGAVSEQQPCVTYLYLYSLKPFWQNVKMQRIGFFAVWLFSIPLVYLFSYGFTSHALQPVAQNHEKQKEFIAFASHELRSPLAVLKTGLSMLEHKPNSGKRERIFSLMGNEMSRMERLVQDLLCLAKVERASLNFQFMPVDLADLAQKVCRTYEGIAKSKGIFLSLEKGGGCPCACDPQRVEQVLVILLDNALHYTPSGQKVAVRLYQQRARCYIQVIDTGVGIPDGEKEKIFDKFYQVSSSRSDKGHFGLGLAIAKEICSSHGGKLSVSDTPGGGSTFTACLPAKR